MNKKCKESKEKLKEEKEIQERLFKLIDQNKSFVFKAGAGAGKTYALVETIKYLLTSKYVRLSTHHQKIAVITFTNVAADEIKERIGETELLHVSTIHDFIWNEIESYKNELVKIHLEVLEKKIKEIDEKIEKLEIKEYNKLEPEEKKEFLSVMESEKRTFYKYYYERDTEARPHYEHIVFSNFCDRGKKILSNIGKFKKLVNYLFRRKRYNKTIEAINRKDKGFNEIEYNFNLNRDRLDRMQISHDSVLIYAKRLIEKYPTLRKIIIHKYPYILVDEYQDTRKEIIGILNELDNYSKSQTYNFVVGYYGDEAQSIYEYGVGSELREIHSDLKEIFKQINRRSYNEVLSVINKIRNDQYKQESIYKDCYGGSVKFYYGNSSTVKGFINKYKTKWRIDEKNPLDCLFLTYRRMQDILRISPLYEVMRKANLYKEGLGYSRINQELLSKDYEKLGEVQKTLYNLFNIFYLLSDKNSSVENILKTKEIRSNLTLASLNSMIKSLKSIEGKNLGEILVSIDKIYHHSNTNKKFKSLINYLLNLDQNINFDLEKYKEFLIIELGKLRESDNLSKDFTDEKIERANKTVKDLLSIEKDIFINWMNYLRNDEKKAIRYHTYHGTKGLEFENVIIIMEERFNRYNIGNYFRKQLNRNSLEGRELKKYNYVRNILYTATSRVIKNLRILYIDKIDGLEKGIEDIFGKPKYFNY